MTGASLMINLSWDLWLMPGKKIGLSAWSPTCFIQVTVHQIMMTPGGTTVTDTPITLRRVIPPN